MVARMPKPEMFDAKAMGARFRRVVRFARESLDQRRLSYTAFSNYEELRDPLS
jgi:hypothetical protein